MSHHLAIYQANKKVLTSIYLYKRVLWPKFADFPVLLTVLYLHFPLTHAVKKLNVGRICSYF